MAKKQSKVRIGQPISITVPDSVREWIDAQIPEGGTRCETVRRILNDVRELEGMGASLRDLLVQVAGERRPRKKTG